GVWISWKGSCVTRGIGALPGAPIMPHRFPAPAASGARKKAAPHRRGGTQWRGLRLVAVAEDRVLAWVVGGIAQVEHALADRQFRIQRFHGDLEATRDL